MNVHEHIVTAHDPREFRHMIPVRMHAARREQSHQVATAAALAQLLDKREEGGVARERAVFHGGIDAGQVLQHRPACADGHVADLGVAHLALGQADGGAGGREQTVGTRAGQAVPDRRFGQGDGVVVPLRPMPPAVQHAEDDGAEGGLRAHVPAF